MSYLECDEPIPGEPETVDAIKTIIIPRARDLGGLEVRRVLPSARRQIRLSIAPAETHPIENFSLRAKIPSPEHAERGMETGQSQSRRAGNR